jgi:oligosaccharide repeat unit polymerase
MIRYLTNPLVLFLAIWGTAGSLYLAGVLTGLFPTPYALTVGVLTLNILAFSLGYLTWALFQDLAPQTGELAPVAASPATAPRMERALAFTLLMGVTALLLMVYRAILIAAYFHTRLVDLLRRPGQLRFGLIVFLERAVSETSLVVKLISLTSGFFAIGFILLGVFLHLGTTRRKYVYLAGFLLVNFATCLINLSRYDMTSSILALILAYGLTSAAAGGERPRRGTRDLWLPAALVVVIFTAIELLLHKSAPYHQAGSLRGVLFSFYWYLASPIAALNEFLGTFQGDYTLGQKTFLPFYKWLARLDLIAPPQVSIFGDFLRIPFSTNTYTYLRHFYEDFGIGGVVLVPYAFGSLLAAVQPRARHYFPFLNMYVSLLVPVCFSFFSYPLVSSQFYLQILSGFVFFRYEMAPARPAQPPPMFRSYQDSST